MFFKYWFRSFWFLFISAFSLKKSEDFIIYLVPKSNLNKAESAIFLASLSFIPGISYLRKSSSFIALYVADERMFDPDDLKKIYKTVHKINDDRLV